MVESSSGVLNAAELAIERVATDSTWKKTAQSGTVFNDISVGDSVYSGTVVDADTGMIPDDNTTKYRIILNSNHDLVTTSARFEMINNPTVDYIGILKDLSARFYWPFDETSRPANALDKLDYQHHGFYNVPSIAGIASNDEGAPVPLFNDANDQIEIPWSDEFKDPKGTFSLWLKSTEATLYKSYGILGMEYKAGGNPNIMLTVFNRGLHAYISNSRSYSMQNVASSDLNILKLDTWHHVALVWGDSGLSIYLDGDQVVHNSRVAGGVDTADSSSGGEQPLRVGEATIVGLLGSHSDVGFKGSIAHLVYIKDTLTDAQISELAKIRPDAGGQGIIEDSWVRVFD